MKAFLNKLFKGIKNRLREKSTWIAIIAAISAVIGIEISPAHQELILSFAAGVGLLGMAATPEA